MTKDLLKIFESNLRKYFENYDSIKISLTDENDLGYPTIKIVSFFEDVSVEVDFIISDFCKLKDLDGNVIDFKDVWKYLHFKSMENLQLAMKRLMK